MQLRMKVKDDDDKSSLTRSTISPTPERAACETTEGASATSSHIDGSHSGSPREFIFSSPALSELRYSVGSDLADSHDSLREFHDSESSKASAPVSAPDEGYVVLPEDEDERQHILEQKGVKEAENEDADAGGAGNGSGVGNNTFDFDHDDAENVISMQRRLTPYHPRHDTLSVLAQDGKTLYKERVLQFEAYLEEECARREREREREQLDMRAQNDGSNPKSGLNLAETNDYGIAVRSVDMIETENSRQCLYNEKGDAMPHVLGRLTASDTPTLSRRASSPTGERMSTSLWSPAHITTPGSAGNKHIKLGSNASVPDTPFTSTLEYFKHLKGKENSHSKSRRNISLPKEIAEMAKERQQDDEFEDGKEDLDQYRDVDLAPLDPVMEDGIAGDLIMLGTPAKPAVNSKMKTNTLISTIASVYGSDESEVPKQVVEGPWIDLHNEAEVVQYELEIPGRYGDLYHATVRTNAPIYDIAQFIRQSGKQLDAPKKSIEAAVQVSQTTDFPFPTNKIVL